MAKGYQLIQAQTLTATATSVTFSNIPQNYSDLVFAISARTDRNAAGDDVKVSFNGSTSNFSYRALEGNGSTAPSYSSSSYNWFGSVNGATNTSNTFSNVSVYVPNYTSSRVKSYSVDSAFENNATFAQLNLVAGAWSNTSAITSVGLTLNTGPNFIAGSTFYLYGVDGTRATGGTITSDKDFTYHTFTSTSTFTALEKIKNAEILMVAGGGGGGGIGGGGGAGGLLYVSGQTFLAGTSYPTTVGAGGNGSTASGNVTTAGAGRGTNSTFASLTAIAGGAGGSYDGGFVSTSGGSSGGLGPLETTPLAATTGQGNQGGNRTNAGGTFYNSGGGGAGGAGGDASANIYSGVGGVGSLSYTNWGLATNTGQNSNGIYYYAGGGGCGSFVGSGLWASDGGLGGGGRGSGTKSFGGVSGTANTGGGGGGGGFDNSGGNGRSNGGEGGSGIVIIRYPNY